MFGEHRRSSLPTYGALSWGGSIRQASSGMVKCYDKHVGLFSSHAQLFPGWRQLESLSLHSPQAPRWAHVTFLSFVFLLGAACKNGYFNIHPPGGPLQVGRQNPLSTEPLTRDKNKAGLRQLRTLRHWWRLRALRQESA